MTKEEFWAKYIELKSKVDDDLRDRAHQILASGAVDLASYDDDFVLPKIILTDALRHEADQWEPFTKKDRETVKNLSHF